MKYQHQIAIFLGCAFFSVAIAASPIAVVNGKPIDQKKVDEFVSTFVKNGEKDTPELRQKIKDVLIDEALISQEIMRLKIDQQKNVKDQIEAAKNNVLYSAFLKHILDKNPIEESDILAGYNDLKKQMKGNKKYYLRQIVVKTEQEANRIIQLLKKQHNAGFEKLAVANSIDSTTAKKGGDMGFLYSKTLETLPHLWAVLSLLKKGQINEKAIESNLGWSIFKVDNITEDTLPSYEESKQKILQKLQISAFTKAIEALRQKATIK